MNLVSKCSTAEMTCCRVARLSTIVDHVMADVQFSASHLGSLGHRDFSVLTPMPSVHNMTTTYLGRYLQAS
jgi:hypothetical protein